MLFLLIVLCVSGVYRRAFFGFRGVTWFSRPMSARALLGAFQGDSLTYYQYGTYALFNHPHTVSVPLAVAASCRVAVRVSGNRQPCRCAVAEFAEFVSV